MSWLFLEPFVANLSTEGFSNLLSEYPSGVYFGWAGVSKQGIYKMVMSIGWNPYFNNPEKTIVSGTHKYTIFGGLLHFALFPLLRFICDFGLLFWRNLGCFMSLRMTFMEKNCALLLLVIYDRRYFASYKMCLSSYHPMLAICHNSDLVNFEFTGQFPFSGKPCSKDPRGRENCRASSWASGLLEIQRWPLFK